MIYRILPPVLSKKNIFTISLLFLEYLFNEHDPVNKLMYFWSNELLESARCIPFYSGRSALTALLKLDLKKNAKKVAVPSFVCPSVVASILSAGKQPLFIDIKTDLTLDPEDLEKKIDKDVSWIIMPHVYGKVCDFTKIKEISISCGCLLVDDSAACAGLQYGSYTMGLLGDAGIASMNYKTISSVMGGMLIIPRSSRLWGNPYFEKFLKNKKDKCISKRKMILLLINYFASGLLPRSSVYKIIKKIGLKKSFCLEPVNEYIEINGMPTISAILSLCQMEIFSKLQKDREKNSIILKNILDRSPLIHPLLSRRKDFNTRFVIKVDNHFHDIQEQLLRINVQCFKAYTPSHLLLNINTNLPVTNSIYNKLFIIPNNPVYSIEDIKLMAEKIFSLASIVSSHSSV